MFTSFLYFEVTLNTLHNFSTCHPGTFMDVAMQNPRRLHIFSQVFKPNKLQELFQKKTLACPFEWTSFKPWCIYEYRVIKRNVNRGYSRAQYTVPIRPNLTESRPQLYPGFTLLSGSVRGLFWVYTL